MNRRCGSIRQPFGNTAGDPVAEFFERDFRYDAAKFRSMDGVEFREHPALRNGIDMVHFQEFEDAGKVFPVGVECIGDHPGFELRCDLVEDGGRGLLPERMQIKFSAGFAVCIFKTAQAAPAGVVFDGEEDPAAPLGEQSQPHFTAGSVQIEAEVVDGGLFRQLATGYDQDSRFFEPPDQR